MEGDALLVFERRSGGYLVSTDPARLEIDTVRGFLARSYWANTRTPDVTERSIRNSLCFGVYHIGGAADGTAGQVAFARVVTDYATFAWLCDVFVAEEARGEGVGKLLVETVLAHPDLQGLRRWLLATADAHGLYARFGFTELPAPERWMELRSAAE